MQFLCGHAALADRHGMLSVSGLAARTAKRDALCKGAGGVNVTCAHLPFDDAIRLDSVVAVAS